MVLKMQTYRYFIACAAIIVLTILRHVHIIQLNSYNFDQEIIWIRKNIYLFLANLVLIISSYIFYKFKILPFLIVIIISLLSLFIENLPRKQKKKLVFTKRLVRLMLICAAIFITFIIVCLRYDKSGAIKYMLYITALSPVVVFVAFFVSLPIENAIRKKFMNEAKKIIDANDKLYTVGITGSFGKTSTKYFLDRLLKIKFSVCKTQESYNTAMGVTLTIKNDLKNINDIFICEMGARRRGDIKEICDIVSPSGAILTDVGNMHLDTFKSIKNILDTKFELIDSVISKKNICDSSIREKIVLLNGDNSIIREKAKEYSFNNAKVYYYGFNKENDFYVDDIRMSEKGTEFTFIAGTSDIYTKSVRMETKLIGKFNVINLVAAVAYAMLLDVPVDDISNEVRHMECVQHRLQLLSNDINNLIIDDAYNSNPKGAKNAVDALAEFTSYTKIIITPGMVELADRQSIENEDFARYAGEKVDYAVVVGETNKESLIKGFKNNLSDDKVFSFSDVNDAIKFARTSINGKKVILLENDLSDNY